MEVPPKAHNTNYANAFVHDDLLYLYNCANDQCYFLRIDLLTGASVSLPLEVPSYWGANCIVQDCAYTFAGKTKYGGLLDTNMYRLQLRPSILLHHDSLSQLCLPEKRYGLAMVHRTVSNELIVFGGYSANDMWAYDLQQLKWRQVKQTSTIVGRHGHGMVYYEAWDCIIVFGGCFNKGNHDTGTVFKFTFANATWTKLGALPSVKQYKGYALHACMMDADMAIVLGNQVPKASAHHLYHIPSGKWQVLHDLPVLPERYAACVYGKNGYIVICNRKIHVIQVHGLDVSTAMGKAMLSNNVLCDIRIIY